VVRHGQGVLNILPMSGVRDEVDRRIISFRPTAGETVIVDSDDDEGDGLAGAVVAI
jgi:hypothetical protein